jgi:hypothetical protein
MRMLHSTPSGAGFALLFADRANAGTDYDQIPINRTPSRSALLNHAPVKDDKRDFEKKAADRARELLNDAKKPDCRKFIMALILRAAEVTSQLSSIILSEGNGRNKVIYNFDVDDGLKAYEEAMKGGHVLSFNERRAKDPKYTMPSGAQGATDTETRSMSGVIFSATTEVTWAESFYKLGLDDAARQTLHESLHQILGFSDQVLANAARYVLGEGQERYKEGSEGRKAASNDLNERIKRKCS